MSKIPNLYLKWRAYRSLIDDSRSDADIAHLVFDEGQRQILFSRLLYGDLNCHQKVAARLVGEVINRCIADYRKMRGLSAEATALSSADLWLPSHEFIRRLIVAAGDVSTNQLDAMEKSLLDALIPTVVLDRAPKLAILRSEIDKSFDGFIKSGGDRPLEFEPGRHRGQFVVEDLTKDPVDVYVFLMRNPYPLAGKRLWELEWGDTVLWLPSPMKIPRTGDKLNLMPPSPVRADLGRFVATAVLVFDNKVLAKLDPRGAKAPPGALDEEQTARFITNMKRLERAEGSPIQVAANEYIVAPTRSQT